MRKLTVVEFMSLDGVIQGPGGPEEDPSDGFRYGGWQAPYDDEEIGRSVLELFSQPFELLLGRRTYDIWAAYWPSIGLAAPEHPIAGPFNRVAKHVATHRPDSLQWQNSHALQGDLVEAVRGLKHQADAPLLTHGSGDLVRQLLAAGLVDDLRLMIYPVMLGRGKRLFGENEAPSSFALTQWKVTPSGVILAQYERRGEVRTGAFGEEKPTPTRPSMA
ncbi:MAG: dihydrofolate reductase family protein [Firmicutes bacterium]|nr:dihydrofolate reductase family protein [Bacillota bacterium]